MELTAFQPEYLPDAANLFVQNFKKQRRGMPFMPAAMEDPRRVAGMLEQMMSDCPGVAALENGKLVGYLGWWIVDHFRDTERRAAYVPEWAHGTVQSGMEASRPGIYRALYRAAATHWFENGCQAHALSLLASDKVAERTWFWSGFGLTVIDAVRPAEPLGCPPPQGLTIRKASLADVELLAEIETEHWKHYAQPPTLMVPQSADDAAGFERLLNNPVNSAWLALDGSEAVAYMRFEGGSYGAADVVQGETSFACTGAFTRPAYRGRGAAAALLDAAIQDYAARGYDCCAVDFESLNPEAAVFWMKYFEPVCLSVVRVPERGPNPLV